MSFFFGTKKQNEQSFLLCCIESGAVHVGLVLVYPKTKPFIVHSVSKAVPFQEILDYQRLTTTTLQALVDACDEVVKKGIPHVSSKRMKNGHIDRVVCVYGSPWYISQIQTVSIEKEAPVVITQKALSDLAAQYVTTDALKAVLASTDDSAYILEQSIVGVRLNGYVVESPFGKEAKNISFSVSSGAISNQFRLYVEESISRFFAHTPFTHHCAPTMAFFGIRDTLASENTFLIIDVSAEVTDISVVRDGALKETATFPYGLRSALRSFAHSSGILQSEALGTAQSLQTNKLDAEVTARYMAGVQKAGQEWKALFEKTLFDIEHDGSIPASAFILGESPEFTMLQKLFIPPQNVQNPRTSTPLEVRPLNGEGLKPFCLVREGIRLSHPLLAFTALYVHKSVAMADNKKGVQ